MLSVMNLEDLFISPDSTIVNALEQLDTTGKHTLLVVDDDRHLLGTLTDGDVRRVILRLGTLDATVEVSYNDQPHFCSIELGAQASLMFDKYGIDAVPLVSLSGEVVDCVFRDGSCDATESEKSIDVPVVMMAGGLGTRLYPYTKVLPKPLIPINDVPIAERIIDAFNHQGCDSFLLIVNHKKGMIKAYFNEIEHDYSIEFVDEDKFLGTGGGLCLVKDRVPDTFFLTNCDILVDTDFSKALELHLREGNTVTMIVSLKNYTIPYGTVEIDAGGGISAMLEKPSIPFLVNTGCYIVDRRALDYIQDGESIGFPDVIERCKNDGKKVGVYPVSEQSWLDMGQLDEMNNMVAMLSDGHQ